MKPHKLSLVARLMLAVMGDGYVLKVPVDDSPAFFVDRYSDDAGQIPTFKGSSGASYPVHYVRESIGPLEDAPVKELIHSGLLHKMVKDRIGDKHSWRMGWKEMGLDGEKADLYTLMQ